MSIQTLIILSVLVMAMIAVLATLFWWMIKKPRVRHPKRKGLIL